MSRAADVVARYVALRGAGVPSWVTGNEAFRMTLGRVGAWNQTGGEGFHLAALVNTGDVRPLDDPAVEAFTRAHADGE